MTNSGCITHDLTGISNILFQFPTSQSEHQHTCLNQLAPERLGDSHVVGITYTKSAESWLAEHRHHTDEDPLRTTVVSIGEQARSTAATVSIPAPGLPRIETVDSATDLAELGIKLSTILDEHQTNELSDDAPDLVLCYDSLTDLLQAVELQRAFRFLHVVTSHVTQSEATAHYHLDPEVHNDETLSIIRPLFDAVAQINDGELVVQKH